LDERITVRDSKPSGDLHLEKSDRSLLQQEWSFNVLAMEKKKTEGNHAKKKPDVRMDERNVPVLKRNMYEEVLMRSI
jgi:predicted ribonuclease toxin of YeeF-YezG toxin-antitoxin module